MKKKDTIRVAFIVILLVAIFLTIFLVDKQQSEIRETYIKNHVCYNGWDCNSVVDSQGKQYCINKASGIESDVEGLKITTPNHNFCGCLYNQTANITACMHIVIYVG